MQLKRVIIHEIEKESGISDTKLILSDEIISNSENLTLLITTLLDSYKGDNILYAIFDDNPGKYFPEKFKDYRNSQRDKAEFIKFTRIALTNLEGIIKAKTLAKGGYFVFAEYTINNINYFSIFLIRDTEGKILKRTDHSYKIDTIEYLDTRSLAMACRINETRIINNRPNYLSFTHLKQSEVSEYFLDWISIKQKESSGEYTQNLYTIINKIEPPINRETNQRYRIDEFREAIYNYVITKPDKTINLNDLGRHFYNDDSKIISFAESIDLPIDTEFRYNKRMLKKFIKVEISKDGITLRFSRGSLNSKVRNSEEDPNIVIIESEDFARALRTELNE